MVDALLVQVSEELRLVADRGNSARICEAIDQVKLLDVWAILFVRSLQNVHNLALHNKFVPSAACVVTFRISSPALRLLCANYTDSEAPTTAISTSLSLIHI